MKEVLTIDFSGSRGGRAPATWAQKGTWQGIRRKGLIPKIQKMAQGADLESLTDALRWAMENFETLRTRYVIDETEGLTQIVESSGNVEILIQEMDDEQHAATADIFAAYVARFDYDPGKHLPVRWGILTADGTPEYLIMAATHLALDGLGCVALQGHLERRLSDRRYQLPAGGHLQPLDRARREQEKPARATHTSALQHWESIFTRYRDRKFLNPTTLMSSPAAWQGAEILAERYAVTTSSIFLGTTAALVSVLTGLDDCTFKAPSSNRLDESDQGHVGHLVQDAFGMVGNLKAGYRDICSGALDAGLDAYFNGQYNPDELRRLRQEMEYLDSVAMVPDFGFNDMSGPQKAGFSKKALTGLAGKTEIRHDGDIFYEAGSKCLTILLYGDAQGEIPGIILTVESMMRHMEGERLLLAFEGLIVSAASGNSLAEESPYDFLSARLNP
ncbi:condensation domain-containing protein [Streptomyces sp. BE230]|uniref:condensation domain-containing protein n=1 Tax=Streptomyces sp. BE230 TaxID=3002526 RepID=UPI002ED0FBD5|nr:condensation domain-containing protein [Streptomyces sp. BE230]